MTQHSSRTATTQAVAYTGTSASASAFGAQTYHVRLCANSACHFKIGDGAQTATTDDPFLPANFEDYVTVSPGQIIAAVRAATDGLVTATSGTLWVTELT
jgi:hypothetical protein